MLVVQAISRQTKDRLHLSRPRSLMGTVQMEQSNPQPVQQTLKLLFAVTDSQDSPVLSDLRETSQECQMLSSVTLNCQVTVIQVLNCLKCKKFHTSSQAMSCLCHGLKGHKWSGMLEGRYF